MSKPFDVTARLADLQQNLSTLRLYALVDGVQYRETFGEPCAARMGFRSLFAGTQDAALAHAGPWLIDAEQVDPALVNALAELELSAPAVSWLISPQTLEGLAQLLQLNLDMELPDGRTALLRFWDPRVLVTLAELLEPSQRATFFAHIYEWHLLHKERRVWIGGRHAQA
jgi:hypothetical protein